MVKYIVIASFYDVEDNNKLYKIGDEFLAPVKKVSKKRLNALLTKKNKAGIAVIEKVEEAKDEQEVEEIQPVEEEKVEEAKADNEEE